GPQAAHSGGGSSMGQPWMPRPRPTASVRRVAIACWIFTPTSIASSTMRPPRPGVPSAMRRLTSKRLPGRPTQRPRRRTMARTTIRVGQRLLNWDGTRGYVTLNTQGKTIFTQGEQCKVEWFGLDGHTIEDAVYLTLEQLEEEGI